MFGFIFILIICFNVQARILGESIAVNPYALPGDSEYNHLGLPGVRFHEANDYFGKTDKLVSGIGSLSVAEVWKHFSTSLTLKGRFIQPITQTRNDQVHLARSMGVYAESMETSWNSSLTLYGREGLGFKLNMGLNYTDVGDHGLVDLYRRIHEAVDSPIKDDTFGRKLHQNFIGSSYGASFIFPVMERVNWLIGASIYNSKMLRENALETSLIVSVARSFALSMKYMVIDQKRSNWWDLTPHRQQFFIGLRLFTFWTPSLMFVSPFVKNDEYGQLYLSPISFTYPF